MEKQNKKTFFRSFRRHFSMVPAMRGKMPRTDSERRAGGASARERMFFCFVFLFSIFYFLFSGATYAQFELPANQLPNLNLKPTLSLTLDPLTPRPNSIMTVTANLSGITNVNNSDYAWFLNGVKQKEASGINKNIFTFQAGDLGAVYKVNASILTPNGDSLSDSISLTVSDFDLTWSASSQAPASYKGKLLPTQNTTINVSALPSIYWPGAKTLVNNNNLIFNWRVDDKFSTDKSGVGKSNFPLRIRDFAGADKSIRLEIKTLDGAVSITRSTVIPIVRPQTLIYFANPKTNLPYGAALKNLITKPANLNFIAQNYFFNAPSKDLKWQWFINNEEVSGENEKPWLASLNLSNIGQSFSARIQASVKNPANDLETAQSTINLEVK